MPKRIPKTFKIEKRHKIQIESRPYSEAPGELICILLDEFFDGKIPAVNIKFSKALALKRKNNGRPKTSIGIGISASNTRNVISKSV